MTGFRSDVAAPQPNPETQVFWAAARSGRLVLRYCAACSKTHWYPRGICPFCFSSEGEWRDVSGRGSVYAFSVMRQVKETYVIAYVTLEEGPTMMTNLVNCDFDALRIGQAVRVVFQPTIDGPPIPAFEPA